MEAVTHSGETAARGFLMLVRRLSYEILFLRDVI